MQRWDWSHPHWCSGLIFSYLSLRQHLSKTVHSTHKPKHLSSYRSLGVSSLFLFKQVPHLTFGATKDQDEGRHSSTHPADQCQPGHSVYAAASCMGMVGQGGQSLSGKYKSLHIQCQVLYKWTNSSWPLEVGSMGSETAKVLSGSKLLCVFVGAAAPPEHPQAKSSIIRSAY